MLLSLWRFGDKQTKTINARFQGREGENGPWTTRHKFQVFRTPKHVCLVNVGGFKPPPLRGHLLAFSTVRLLSRVFCTVPSSVEVAASDHHAPLQADFSVTLYALWSCTRSLCSWAFFASFWVVWSSPQAYHDTNGSNREQLGSPAVLQWVPWCWPPGGNCRRLVIRCSGGCVARKARERRQWDSSLTTLGIRRRELEAGTTEVLDWGVDRLPLGLEGTKRIQVGDLSPNQGGTPRVLALEPVWDPAWCFARYQTLRSRRSRLECSSRSNLLQELLQQDCSASEKLLQQQTAYLPWDAKCEIMFLATFLAPTSRST